MRDGHTSFSLVCSTTDLEDGGFYDDWPVATPPGFHGYGQNMILLVWVDAKAKSAGQSNVACH